MFVKVHEQIFNSSIMEEDLEIRYIWFCLLTLADREGFVDMTTASIARRINIEEDIVVKAIEKFMQPDPTSRTPAQEGRRLEKIRESFGWKIINYMHYRDLRSEENRREYMRNYMRDKRDVNKKANIDVNCKQSKPSLAHTDADTDTDTDAFKRVVHQVIKKFNEIWIKYPKRQGKKAAFRHYKASIKTDNDFLLIYTALDNYLKSETVKKGFIQNGSTWFNNWRDWIDYQEPQQREETVEDRHKRELEETKRRLGY